MRASLMKKKNIDLAFLSHSQLVVSISSDISHPRQGLVSTPFNNLEVTNLYATNSKIWNLKLDGYGSLPGVFTRVVSLLLAATVSFTGTDGWQSKVSPHEIFSSTVKLLDVPNNSVFIREVGDVADAGLEGGTVHVRRDRYDDLNVVCNAAGFELRTRLDHVLYARTTMRLDDSLNPYEGLDVSVETVGHEIELTVGRDETDGTVILKAGETHTLVEFDVLKLN
mmetsp:Transcript_7224/g.9802  ORF Transcript_7224/g.9802 Transcript_7224/m.9802 type:complete len:224 (-) Transcript_7224:894-1565(-)